MLLAFFCLGLFIALRSNLKTWCGSSRLTSYEDTRRCYADLKLTIFPLQKPTHFHHRTRTGFGPKPWTLTLNAIQRHSIQFDGIRYDSTKFIRNTFNTIQNNSTAFNTVWLNLTVFDTMWYKFKYNLTAFDIKFSHQSLISLGLAWTDKQPRFGTEPTFDTEVELNAN